MKGFTLKGQTRVLGVDDGPYVRGSSRTLLVLTVYRLDRYIDGIMTAEVATDGDNSSEVIAEMLNRSRFKEQIRCIISDGACLAGFNVLDMDDLGVNLPYRFDDRQIPLRIGHIDDGMDVGPLSIQMADDVNRA